MRWLKWGCGGFVVLIPILVLAFFGVTDTGHYRASDRDPLAPGGDRTESRGVVRLVVLRHEPSFVQLELRNLPLSENPAAGHWAAVISQVVGVSLADVESELLPAGLRRDFRLDARFQPALIEHGVAGEFVVKLDPLAQELHNSHVASLDVIFVPEPNRHGLVTDPVVLRNLGQKYHFSTAEVIRERHWFVGARPDHLLWSLVALAAATLIPVSLLWRRQQWALTATAVAPSARWRRYLWLQTAIGAATLVGWYVISTPIAQVFIEVWWETLGEPFLPNWLIKLIVRFAPIVVVAAAAARFAVAIYHDVRAIDWPAGRIVRLELLSQAGWVLPIMLGISAFELWQSQREIAVGLGLGALAMWGFVGNQTKQANEANLAELPEGPMRDAISATLSRANLIFDHIYRHDTSRQRESNPVQVKAGYAHFADVVLDTLTPVEVQAVVAREVARLKRGHDGRLQKTFWIAFVAALALGWIFADPLQIAIALLFLATRGLLRLAQSEWTLDLADLDGFNLPTAYPFAYLIQRWHARRLEGDADRVGVELTGDSAAMMSALGKLADLGFLPDDRRHFDLQRLTQPSTRRRLAALGRLANQPTTDPLATATLSAGH